MTPDKRQHGQFYTVKNPFTHPAFRRWARTAGLPTAPVLEPFAGCNSLITHLQTMHLCHTYAAFDIAPTAPTVARRDTLHNFPRGYPVCITNPPWLAKNSATARALPFPDTPYDDLYKHSLARCLDHCAHLAVLVPESFIRTGLFRDRLHTFISLTEPIFADTAHPVALALFLPRPTPDITIYSGPQKIGLLTHLERHRPHPTPHRRIIFNAPTGNLGLIAVDNTHTASIRFCHPREIAHYRITDTSRYITRLSVSGSRLNIDTLNATLHQFRETTGDVLMTPYRGLRKDGKYRRRLDWKLAKGIICTT